MTDIVPEPAASDSLLAADVVHRATRVLDDRGLVILPASGRYAAAADALDEDAVAALFDVTGRPADAPPSVLVGDFEEARHVARVTPLARELARRFLPGPLVILLPAVATAPDLLVHANSTVAVRVPEDAFARGLASHFGPVTAARAARFGDAAPTRVADARAALPGAALVVDGGALTGGRATVVDATGAAPRVVREGAVAVADVVG